MVEENLDDILLLDYCVGEYFDFRRRYGPYLDKKGIFN